MSENKEQLRERYKKIRLLISSSAAEEDSVTICRKVFREVDWTKIKKVSAYSPIAKLKEVDIIPLLQAIEYKYPEINIKVLGRSMKEKIPRTKFDMIIVPVLAFDGQNHRLGWGGGFYDKFLARQPQALKVGVCYKSGYVRNGLPREPHDIPLDQIITEV